MRELLYGPLRMKIEAALNAERAALLEVVRAAASWSRKPDDEDKEDYVNKCLAHPLVQAALKGEP